MGLDNQAGNRKKTCVGMIKASSWPKEQGAIIICKKREDSAGVSLNHGVPTNNEYKLSAWACASIIASNKMTFLFPLC